MKTMCVVCQMGLVATVIHSNDNGSTLWKDMPATEATHLPSNEQVVKLSCSQCGILYDHEVS